MTSAITTKRMDITSENPLPFETNFSGLESSQEISNTSQFNLKDIDDLQDDIPDWSSTEVLPSFVHISIPDALSPSERLELWFAYMKMTMVDIISQLGGSSAVFFIHVESLILKFSLDPALQFDYNQSQQSLHLIFYIENFLSSLSQCGGMFRLIFLDSFKPLLKSISPFLLAIRDNFLLSCILARNMEHVDFAVFPCFEDPLFVKYLHNIQPPFFLVDDCTYYRDNLQVNNADGPLWSLPYLLIHRILEADVHAALLFSIHSKGRKTYAFCMSPPIYSIGNVSASALISNSTTLKCLHCSNRDTGSSILEDFISLFHTYDFHHIGLRDLFIATYLSTLMNNPSVSDSRNVNEGIFFSKLLLLSSQLCRLLPLQSRALLGFDIEDSQHVAILSMKSQLESAIQDYLKIINCETETLLLHTKSTEHVCEASKSEMLAQLASLMFKDNWDASFILKDLLDIIDARFLMILAILLGKQAAVSHQTYVDASFVGLPSSVTQELDRLLSLVNRKTEETGFFPIHLESFPAFVQTCASAVPRNLTEAETALPTLQELQSQFLERLMEWEESKSNRLGQLPGTHITKASSSFGNKFWKSDIGQSFTPGLLLDVAELQIEHRLTADNLTSFVNKKALEGLRGAQRDKMIRKQRLRIAQRGACTVHKFGASLGTPSRYHHSIKVSARGQHVWSQVLDNQQEDVEVNHHGMKKKHQSIEPKKKVSVKVQKIIEQNEQLQRQKNLRTDNERLPTIMTTIAALRHKRLCPGELCSRILDILVGTLRYTEEIIEFPALTSLLYLPESRCQVLMAIVDVLIRVVLEHDFTEEIKESPSLEQEINSLLCFTFQLIHQIFHFFSTVLSSDSIMKMQTVLIMCGFVSSAEALFEAWKSVQTHMMLNSSLETNTATETVGKDKKALKKKNVTKSNPKSNAVSRLLDFFVRPTTVRRFSLCIPPNLENEIQMLFMGHQMTRSLGSCADARVKFHPDSWQVRLLDIIDDYRSTLVCAPTGCGKTFACYYAMEKVLTYDNDGVCVFVCPSKALVQQVEHEVKARFSTKEYPPGCRMGLIGSLLTHVEDKPLKCQILLTLPSMFEVLLMSPHYRDWVSRLRYVILDEIHCIGEGDEEGRAWERLIQLIPCPFIALSATVGNPLSFHHWLSNAHKSKENMVDSRTGSNVEIISFRERYADLNYYIYGRSTPASVTSGVSNDSPFGVIPLNPLVCLSFIQIFEDGISKTFYLPSEDLLKAYNVVRDVLCCHYSFPLSSTSNNSMMFQSLSEIQKQELLIFINDMHPGKYFINIASISKRQYRYYLCWFLNSISCMIRTNIISQYLFEIIVHDLTDLQPLKKRGDMTRGTLWAPSIKKASSEVLNEVKQGIHATEGPAEKTMILESLCRRDVSMPQLQESFHNPQALLDFCRQLDKLGLLPVLLFNFNRSVVTHLFRCLLNLLVELQHKKYYGSPEAEASTRAINKKRMDDYKALVRHSEMMQKLKSVSKRQREEEDIEIDVADSLPLPPPPIDIADEYDEEFNFVNRRVWGTHHDEVEDIINGISNRLRKKDAFYVEGLRRGIAFHHSGLGRRYRAGVEMLFRMGFLRVVFSTETLSLGVNMPCKATVFLGDSVMLTPLLFRQTSGRAGRRGYDVSGHVVFWDVPFYKIRRLICAQLPVLSGEFNVTVTDVLRTYQLINTVDGKQKETLQAKRKDLSSVQLKKLKDTFVQQSKNVQDSVLRMYHAPLLMVSAVTSQESIRNLLKLRCAVKYAFRFAANQAQMCNLLNENAVSTGLAGLATLLYTEEPGSLGFIACMLSGRVWEYLNAAPRANEILPFDKSHSDSQFPFWMLRRFVTLVAQFVAPVPLSYNVYLRMRIVGDMDPLLPAVDPLLEDALSRYNAIAFANAKNYIRCFASSFVNWNTEYRLPITRVDYSNQEASPFSQTSWTGSSLYEQLKSQVISAKSRSPFTALCGRSDTDFHSIYELQSSKPQEVFFDPCLVSYYSPPSVMFKNQKRYLLSNYALHFYTYKNQKRTAEAANVNINDMWDHMTRFESCLWAIKTYIEKACRIMVHPKDLVDMTSGEKFFTLVSDVLTGYEKCKRAEAAV